MATLRIPCLPPEVLARIARYAAHPIDLGEDFWRQVSKQSVFKVDWRPWLNVRRTCSIFKQEVERVYSRTFAPFIEIFCQVFEDEEATYMEYMEGIRKSMASPYSKNKVSLPIFPIQG